MRLTRIIFNLVKELSTKVRCYQKKCKEQKKKVNEQRLKNELNWEETTLRPWIQMFKDEEEAGKKREEELKKRQREEVERQEVEPMEEKGEQPEETTVLAWMELFQGEKEAEGPSGGAEEVKGGETTAGGEDKERGEGSGDADE